MKSGVPGLTGFVARKYGKFSTAYGVRPSPRSACILSACPRFLGGGRVSGEETTGWVSGRQQLRLVCGHLHLHPMAQHFI